MSNVEAVRRYRAKYPERCAAVTRAWRKKNPRKARALALLATDRRMGIEPGTIERLMREQFGVCAHCRITPVTRQGRGKWRWSKDRTKVLCRLCAAEEK